MVLHVDGKTALPGFERHALRHRPARERAVALEAEVVVEPAGICRWTTKIGCFPRFLPENGSGVCFGSRLRR